MREILFRGFSKNLTENQWFYGDLIQYSENEFYILEPNYKSWDILHDGILVVKESIGQFTGLIDKNGNKIFEGDLCRFKWNPILNEPSDLFTFELPVVYYKIWGCWCFHLKTNKMNEPQKELFTDYSIEEKYVAIGSPIEYAENPSDGVEIIGNIHEKSKV